MVYQKDYLANKRFEMRILRYPNGIVINKLIKDRGIKIESPKLIQESTKERIGEVCSNAIDNYIRESIENKEENKVEFLTVEDTLGCDQVETLNVEDIMSTAVKFGFIGAGQAGGKIAEKFYQQGYRRILAVNTTSQDFAGLNFEHKLLIGNNTNGAGKDPSVGRKAAIDCREKIFREIREAFGTDVEHIMVITSTGGGTGAGSCEVLIDIAKDYLKSLKKEPKVGVIVTTPKATEGVVVKNNSETLMESLRRKMVSREIYPVVITDNEKILKMYPRVAIAKFFDIVNKQVASFFNMFNQLSAQDSPYSTLDCADYRSILGSGLIVFGANPILTPEKATAISEAIEKNLTGGLLADVNLKSATHAGAILVASAKRLEEIPQSNFDMAFETLTRVLESNNLLLHTGIYEGPEDKLGDKAYLYLMLGGNNLLERT